MLDFYLGAGGIDNPGHHLGGFEMNEFSWLQKNGFLLESQTGHYSEGDESIPYFDDCILTPEQVQKIYAKFLSRLSEALATPSFKSSTVDKLDRILKAAITSNQGLSTLAD